MRNDGIVNPHITTVSKSTFNILNRARVVAIQVSDLDYVTCYSFWILNSCFCWPSTTAFQHPNHKVDRR